MEGGSSERGGKREKESISIFCFYKPFVFIKLPVLVAVSCALHWLVFFYVWLQGHTIAVFTRIKQSVELKKPRFFFFYMFWFNYIEEKGQGTEFTLPRVNSTRFLFFLT